MERAKVTKEVVILAILAEVSLGRSVAAAIKLRGGEESSYRIEEGDPILQLAILMRGELAEGLEAMESLLTSEGYDASKAVYTFSVDGKLFQVNI